MTKLLIILIGGALMIGLWFRRRQEAKLADVNIQAGEAFLRENRNNVAVEQTESGLQFEILHPGHGNEHPTAKDHVSVHYHGTLINGQVFDSSVERNQPASFPVNRVIAGWIEGLQLMVVGEKRRFFIPSHLAYGNHSAGKIPPGSVLIFDVELLKINGQ